MHCHKDIDLVNIWKDIISWVCLPNMKSLYSDIIANVKVDNRQTNKWTDKQTNKQMEQKQYAPNHSIQEYENLYNKFQISISKD